MLIKNIIEANFFSVLVKDVPESFNFFFQFSLWGKITLLVSVLVTIIAVIYNLLKAGPLMQVENHPVQQVVCVGFLYFCCMCTFDCLCN